MYNVEAFYRYSSKEKEKVSNEPIDFEKFSFKALNEYRQFHGYYADKCAVGNKGAHSKRRVYSDGFMTKLGQLPPDLCCIDVTYEDLQSSVFVRELLRKLLEMWVGEYLGPDAIWRGVERATRYLKPLHGDHGTYASGERFTAAHLLKLAELGIQN